MGVTFHRFDEVLEKLDHFFDGMDDELRDVGQVAAQSLVAQTLDGRGADDQPFAPYSESYRRQLERAGAVEKATRPDLRGVFPHASSGAGRGKRADAPRPLRAARGIVDPQSELDVDLITVMCSGGVVKLTYRPRTSAYMIWHNDGTGRAPQRKWFTLRRREVQEDVARALSVLIENRVRRFNQKDSGSAPARSIAAYVSA